MERTSFTIEFEKENDGRWIAEVQELPGVICYGASKQEAQAKAEALALRVVADRLDAGEETRGPISVEFSAVT
jgi:predicted RNase H-like HicB family nuclease